MINHFLLGVLIGHLCFFWQQQILNSLILIRCAFIFLFFQIFLINYWISKFLFTLNLSYNYNFSCKYLIIYLFNTNWLNLFFLGISVFFIFIFKLKLLKYYYFFHVVGYLLSSLFLIILLKNFAEIIVYTVEKIFFFQNFFLSLNFGLLNNLVLIHPYLTQLLYSFFSLIIFQCLFFEFFIIFYRNFWIFSRKKFFWLKNFFFNIYIELLSLVHSLLLIAYSILLLGGVWAAQELIWNNWWSWDIIELIALSFFILLINFFHFLKNHNQLWNIYFLGLNSSSCCLLFYLFIRIDISLSLHAFNTFLTIEIYFFFFGFWLVFFFFFFLNKKKIFVDWYYNIYTLLFFKKKFFLLSLMWKFLFLNIYIFCFFLWSINLKNFFLKNEIIWFYGFFYKYFVFIILLKYYWEVKKINWILTITTGILNFFLLYLYNLYKFFFLKLNNYYVILHFFVIIFLSYLLLDSMFQFFETTKIYFYNFDKNYFQILKKNFFFISSTSFSPVKLFFQTTYMYYITYKNYLFFNYSALFINNFVIHFWVNQLYNYYQIINIFDTQIFTFLYKEIFLKIWFYKINHHCFLNYSFFLFLFWLFLFQKKIKKFNNF